MVDPERDHTEIALVRLILKTGMPTLAICRGLQVVKVALGGTLFEHLADEVGDRVAHRLPPRQPTHHEITVQPDSRLARVLGSTQFTAASWHHQAIRDLAPSLAAVAFAPDGTIEAVESSDYPSLLAVQWHPELSAAEVPVQQRMFDALITATTVSEPSCEFTS